MEGDIVIECRTVYIQPGGAYFVILDSRCLKVP